MVGLDQSGCPVGDRDCCSPYLAKEDPQDFRGMGPQIIMSRGTWETVSGQK